MNIVVLPIVVAVILTSIIGVYSISTNSEYDIADTAINQITQLTEKKNEIIIATVKDNILHFDNHGLKFSEIYLVDFVLEGGDKKRILYSEVTPEYAGIPNLDVLTISEDLMIQTGASHEINLDTDYGIESISDVQSASVTTVSGNTFSIDIPSNLALTDGVDTGDTGTDTGTGDTHAMINGMGISSRIIQTEFTDGRMTHGTGMIGTDVSVKPYVAISADTDFASLVRDTDAEINCLIPELYRSYQYSNCTLTDVTPSGTPNIFSYSSISNGDTPSTVRSNGEITITYSDRVDVNTRTDGIVFSGTGKVVLKPNPALIEDMIFRGSDMNNADVKIVTSVLALDTLRRSQGEFIIYDAFDDPLPLNQGWRNIMHSHDNSDNHRHSINDVDLTSHPNLTIDSDIDLRANILTNMRCFERSINDRCHGLIPGYDTHYNEPRVGYHIHSSSTVKPAIPTVLQNTDGTSIITELRAAHTLWYSSTQSDERSFSWGTGNSMIYSQEPFTVKHQFDTDFGELVMPSENMYIIVTLDGGSVHLKGESISEKSHFLKIDGISPNTPYQIIKNTLPIITGMTSSTGQIFIERINNDDNKAFIKGAILKLFPDSAAYRGEFSTIAFDGLNGGTLYVDTQNHQTYTVHAYVSIPVTGEITVTNVNLDGILPIPYLEKTYLTGNYILVPIVPGFFTINMEINGITVSLQYGDVLGTTGITLIEPTASTIIKSDISSPLLSAESTAGVTAYAIATSPGTMKAIITETISGQMEIINKHTLNTPPPPPLPPRPRDPLSGYVDVFVNGELVKEIVLGVNDNPESALASELVGVIVTKSAMYWYEEQVLTGAVSVPVIPGDFVEFYVYGKIYGEIDSYTAPAGRSIVSSFGESTATVIIHSAYIVTDN